MSKDTLAQTIGHRILLRRKQLGYTQEQAAEKAGLSHQFFSTVETGRKNIRADSIIKVARALEVSTDYLLLGSVNQVDINNINESLSQLNGIELHCLEEIVKNYLKALEHNNTRRL
ncbi:helix-turn-helix domain-containing protein [Alkaliphilus peptidifermentans]|uniref:Helix-turn-helix domain-containing protein n=1 Tax=Alkaliphilus peptidifermentans DSM 18978 TaxID=1120976 RepID=A0A1G5AFQ2_9FIRM|nr:helix-turn-helix transcriptional regulator [Alkaliphilus peptidifermentans]SCX76711.1 Helix-turn-helix domain-containing protein [Alkaliphilus peptidifermentans DSM 18978]